MSMRDDYPGFRLRLTRWGGLFLLLALLMGFAAVNTGNNGLMSLVGAALGSYVVSGFWSRHSLGRIHVRPRLSSEIYARKEMELILDVENSSRLLPSYGVVFRDEEDNPVGGIGCLGPGQRRVIRAYHTFSERGIKTLRPWRVEILLPLGFFKKSKRIFDSIEVLVFPQPLEGPAHISVGKGSYRGSRLGSEKGREGDVFQLRDFREGDDQRLVHWKQSARQERLIAMERRRSESHSMILRIDPEAYDPRDPTDCSRFEDQLSFLTAIILHRLERKEPVTLEIGSRTIGPEAHRRTAGKFLEALALAEPGKGSRE